ncbi:hypothetical protein DCAR_0518502 [Daucus carota subsp. sativus]|uniref:Glucose-methanol-choline oxidoreductase N-terminal domain-containing protein n=1 Tax=Daucus carota subsp. sativus TaxID=79200 RepID=A0AAF0X125_DAUCS|nr:hypothetical protein DCAR_0518502 [Daucus carota subsp. sativus]
MIMKLFLLVSFLLLLTSCQGRRNLNTWEDKYPFIRYASSFSSSSSTAVGKAYDYIIVGGGTAGCPLAATLSQNFSVLLLERGGVPFTNRNVSFLRNFHISLADLSPTSASQYFISSEGVFNSRARVLGGGTCINAGFYTRPSHRQVPLFGIFLIFHQLDIERLGLDAKLVNESYPWIENQIVHMPKLTSWQRAMRYGLLEVGISPDNGFTYDHLYGTKVGGTTFDRYGRRHSAAELLKSATRENLDVLIHATVQKVVFDKSGKKPKAIGVTFKDEKGKQHLALLSNKQGSEIILSSGAIGTPQLLLLSGVGPKADLERMNISMVLDNEFVGKGMSDNPMNSLFVPFKTRMEQSLIQTVGIAKTGVYIEASSGFSQSPDSIHCNHGMLSAEIGQLSTIPPKQRTKEAIEAFKRNKHNLPHEVFKGGFILGKVAHTKSRGKLSLCNTNIDDNPSVSFNYFSHPHDLQQCVHAFHIIEKLVKSTHLTNYMPPDEDTFEKLLNLSVLANVNLLPRHANDTRSLKQFCKDTVTTIWHFHGGCQVGKVVNSDYKVLGVQGLRVIDGSTFSQSPGTNPQATLLMMGRYMGVKILRSRLGKAAGI